MQSMLRLVGGDCQRSEMTDGQARPSAEPAHRVKDEGYFFLSFLGFFFSRFWLLLPLPMRVSLLDRPHSHRPPLAASMAQPDFATRVHAGRRLLCPIRPVLKRIFGPGTCMGGIRQ